MSGSGPYARARSSFSSRSASDGREGVVRSNDSGSEFDAEGDPSTFATYTRPARRGQGTQLGQVASWTTIERERFYRTYPNICRAATVRTDRDPAAGTWSFPRRRTDWDEALRFERTLGLLARSASRPGLGAPCALRKFGRSAGLTSRGPVQLLDRVVDVVVALINLFQVQAHMNDQAVSFPQNHHSPHCEWRPICVPPGPVPLAPLHLAVDRGRHRGPQ